MHYIYCISQVLSNSIHAMILNLSSPSPIQCSETIIHTIITSNHIKSHHMQYASHNHILLSAHLHHISSTITKLHTKTVPNSPLYFHSLNVLIRSQAKHQRISLPLSSQPRVHLRHILPNIQQEPTLSTH